MNIQKLTGRNIITIDEMQEYMNNYDSSVTGFMQTCISAVSNQFENYIGKPIKLNTFSDLYDGSGNNTMYLAYYPVISLSALQYRMSPIAEWTDFYDLTGSASANVQLNYATGELNLYNQYFRTGFNNVRAIYTAGFSDPPFDLKKICKEAVMTMYKESGQGSNLLGLQTSNINEGNSFSETYKDLWTEWQRVLDLYIKQNV